MYNVIMKKKILIICFILLGICFLGLGTVFAINGYVKGSTKNQIVNIEETKEFEAEAIIILGCYVKPDGSPSMFLEDRLKTGYEVYKELRLPIIVSGDHGQKRYDEVNTMKEYLINLGVSSEDIFMDHAGFATYESVYRAKDIFELKKAIFITQEYHLYRTLYIANKLGVEAVGIKADINSNAVRNKDLGRELLARNKDFVKVIFKPEPTYLGDTISVNGSGDITNDKE